MASVSHDMRALARPGLHDPPSFLLSSPNHTRLRTHALRSTSATPSATGTEATDDTDFFSQSGHASDAQELYSRPTHRTLLRDGEDDEYDAEEDDAGEGVDGEEEDVDEEEEEEEDDDEDSSEDEGSIDEGTSPLEKDEEDGTLDFDPSLFLSGLGAASGSNDDSQQASHPLLPASITSEQYAGAIQVLTHLLGSNNDLDSFTQHPASSSSNAFAAAAASAAQANAHRTEGAEVVPMQSAPSIDMDQQRPLDSARSSTAGLDLQPLINSLIARLNGNAQADQQPMGETDLTSLLQTLMATQAGAASLSDAAGLSAAPAPQSSTGGNLLSFADLNFEEEDDPDDPDFNPELPEAWARAMQDVVGGLSEPAGGAHPPNAAFPASGSAAPTPPIQDHQVGHLLRDTPGATDSPRESSDVENEEDELEFTADGKRKRKRTRKYTPEEAKRRRLERNKLCARRLREKKKKEEAEMKRQLAEARKAGFRAEREREAAANLEAQALFHANASARAQMEDLAEDRSASASSASGSGSRSGSGANARSKRAAAADAPRALDNFYATNDLDLQFSTSISNSNSGGGGKFLRTSGAAARPPSYAELESENLELRREVTRLRGEMEILLRAGVGARAGLDPQLADLGQDGDGEGAGAGAGADAESQRETPRRTTNEGRRAGTARGRATAAVPASAAAEIEVEENAHSPDPSHATPTLTTAPTPNPAPTATRSHRRRREASPAPRSRSRSRSGSGTPISTYSEHPHPSHPSAHAHHQHAHQHAHAHAHGTFDAAEVSKMGALLLAVSAAMNNEKGLGLAAGFSAHAGHGQERAIGSCAGGNGGGNGGGGGQLVSPSAYGTPPHGHHHPHAHLSPHPHPLSHSHAQSATGLGSLEFGVGVGPLGTGSTRRVTRAGR